MMNSTAPGTGLLLLWGLHIISIIVVGIGIALLLIWAFKYLSEKNLWKWGWVLVVLGTILCLLTISAWPSFGMMGSFNGGFNRSGNGMMPIIGQWQGSEQNTESAAQQKEVADGKIIYDKFQTKRTTCAAVSDSDFELMGEYLMAQMAGTGHEQMNARIQQMMGKEGEEQMHIMMAKRVSGCIPGEPSQGMMDSTGSPQVNGGGMMRSAASSVTSAVDEHHTSSISQ